MSDLSREASAWTVMLRRCTDPKQKDFRFYGAKGITVCREWSESFHAFLADVGRAPTRKHWLGRLDVTKGYLPGNVAWATQKEQSRRRQRCQFIEVNGERLTLGEAERAAGLKDGTLRNRLRAGDDLADALTREPCRTGRPPNPKPTTTKETTHE